MGKKSKRKDARPKTVADRERLPYRKGVGAVLLNQDGLVFVARRNDVGGEAWQMPQGGIDDDEDPRSAVMRELEEEVGTDAAEIIAESPGWFVYDLPDALLGKAWKGRYRGQMQKWFLLRFLGDDSEINLEASGHPEFDAWRWIPLDDVPQLIVPFKRSVYEEIVAAFHDQAKPIKRGGRGRGR